MTMVRSAPTASPRDAQQGDDGHEPVRERTPWLLALLCLLIPIMPSYIVLAGPLKSNGSPARIIAFVLFSLTVLGFVLMWRTARTRTIRPGVIVILVYFLMVLLVYGVGLSHLDSALAEPNKNRAILTVTANVGVGLYALLRIKTMRQRTIILGCLAIGLTFNCVVALLQISTHIDLHTFLQPPGFVDNQTDLGRGLSAVLSDRFGAERAFGTSGHPIEFAVLAGVTVPLTIHFARYATKWQVRLLAALATGVALFAMPVAISRSGLIAAAAAILIYMWTFTLRGLAYAVAIGAVAIIGNMVAAPAVSQALWQTITNSAQDSSVLDRVAAYAKVSDTLRDHPIFGVGLGANPPNEYGFLDNEWLQALVQGGGVGFVAMIAICGGGVFGIAAALRRAATPRERDQAYAMGAMFVGFLVSSYTFDLFGYQQASFVFFVLFGLLWSNFTVPFREPKIVTGTKEHLT